MKNKILPDKLKDIRKAKGMTQADVAASLNIGRQAYSHYETGARTPSTDTLYRLAGLYNIPIEDLMHICVDVDRDVSFDAPTPTESSQDFVQLVEFINSPKNKQRLNLLTQYEKELLYYIENISEEDRQEILEIAKMKSRKKRN